MSHPREIAIRIVHGLNAARRASSRDNPVDEFGLIEAALGYKSISVIHKIAKEDRT